MSDNAKVIVSVWFSGIEYNPIVFRGERYTVNNDRMLLIEGYSELEGYDRSYAIMLDKVLWCTTHDITEQDNS